MPTWIVETCKRETGKRGKNEKSFRSSPILRFYLVPKPCLGTSWGEVLRHSGQSRAGGEGGPKPELGTERNFEQSAIRIPHSAFAAGGFTLLEVLVAMAVLAVALVGLLGLYNHSLLLTIRAQRLSTATLLAQEMLTRTQLEGVAAARLTAGDFADLHPGQYPEFRWYRTVRPTPIEGLWELHVGVSWGEHEGEACELTLFAPLEGL
jgi:general secretion pathway protein I